MSQDMPIPQDALDARKIIIPDGIDIEFLHEGTEITQDPLTNKYTIASKLSYVAEELDPNSETTGKKVNYEESFKIELDLEKVGFTYLPQEDIFVPDRSRFNNLLVNIVYMRHYNVLISSLDKILEQQLGEDFELLPLPSFKRSNNYEPFIEFTLEGEQYRFFETVRQSWSLGNEDKSELNNLDIRTKSNLLKIFFKEMYEILYKETLAT